MAAFCGDQFSEEEKEKREKFFSLFYLFINVGAIGSSYSTPYLKSISKDTYWISFIVPSALMIVAVVVYVASSMNFTIVPPSGEMLPIIKAMGGCSRSAKAKYAASRARKLTVLVLPTIAFWMVFDLAGSLFTIQAGMLNRVIKLPFIGEYWLKTGSCETMNPIDRLL